MRKNNIAFEDIIGRYLNINVGNENYRIYVEEAGEGIPLLCLHTAGSDGRQFRHILNDKKILENFVNSKKYNLAFKLCPTNISEVLAYAEKKKYMPQKSTWFHPKPLDGLISSKIIS